MLEKVSDHSSYDLLYRAEEFASKIEEKASEQKHPEAGSLRSLILEVVSEIARIAEESFPEQIYLAAGIGYVTSQVPDDFYQKISEETSKLPEIIDRREICKQAVYLTIQRGGNRIGARRGALLAKALGLDKPVVSEAVGYGLDRSDPHFLVFYNHFEDMIDPSMRGLIDHFSPKDITREEMTIGKFFSNKKKHEDPELANSAF